MDLDYSILDEFPDVVEDDLHYVAQLLARMRDRLVDGGHGSVAGVVCRHRRARDITRGSRECEPLFFEGRSSRPTAP